MILEKLYEMVGPVVDDAGYILWGIETVGEGALTIRIYIDHEDGVSVGDCQKISREISSIFDVEDPISGNYILEVSSPGMNRQVFNISQAEALIGFTVKAVTYSAINSQTKFKGDLSRVEGNTVFMKLESGEGISFDFEDLKRMRVSPEF